MENRSDLLSHKPHKNNPRGNAGMDIPKKEHKIGNTTVIIHSPLVAMSEGDRKQWFEEEWEKGNQVLRDIADAVHNCYR
ncbi:hypothetical protein KO561_05130 [Radiobacillus kanasensis]|uniref:hypothetical protein n=1 Tax=Radiobacillus kanasensis TaxID=2844358 RepID=UPI001E44E3D5|nr:hypothetical protein [Radiobacillus kanasensis]UFU00335.1 hypothetical protein KO561_05130 [Radiobacillus kanasensis]